MLIVSNINGSFSAVGMNGAFLVSINSTPAIPNFGER
jgi:hypothetical protein